MPVACVFGLVSEVVYGFHPDFRFGAEGAVGDKPSFAGVLCESILFDLLRDLIDKLLRLFVRLTIGLVESYPREFTTLLVLFFSVGKTGQPPHVVSLCRAWISIEHLCQPFCSGCPYASGLGFPVVHPYLEVLG